jgi:cyclophilin family peptidyl-prolyl cis-trans isomerase
MRTPRKTLITLIILFLFGGTIIIQAVNLFFGQQTPKIVTETVVIETSMGILQIELDFGNANTTASNFKRYVEDGFYDSTVFHRVVRGFIIQGGAFTYSANLNNLYKNSTYGPIKLESNNGLKNDRGTIAMARDFDPDSATSQFFINTEDNNLLNYSPSNPGYAVFGDVIKGMNVVDAIEEVETEKRGDNEYWPIKDIVIIRAYMKTN